MGIITERLKSAAVNAGSWKSPARVVVIESDDWGMIRMASMGAFERLQTLGYPVEECPYNRYDMLESQEDLAALADTLRQFRDHRGRFAKITANMIVGNPDFERIREDRFENYFVLPFWETLRAYGQESAIDTYREVYAEKLLMPQLHGREHTAVPHWLKALRNGIKRFTDAFDEGMYTLHPGGSTSGRRDLLDAFGYAPSESYFSRLAPVLTEAQGWFEEFWGIRSKTFISPCYTWHPALEEHLAMIGITCIQGSRVQRVPGDPRETKPSNVRRFTGQVNKYGQRSLVRNVSLEPSLWTGGAGCVESALSEVSRAFRFRAPAIVSSHRLNYIGGLDQKNRERGLRTLAHFLSEVLRKWPDVEFLSSDELGARMGV